MTEPKKVDEGFAVAAQPDKAGIAAMARAGYRTLINNRPDGEEPGQISAAEARAEAERLGLRYVHIPVTGASISADDVRAFHRAVQEGPQPVVAHCRSGTRSYTLWAAAQALHGGAQPEELVRRAAADGYNLASLPQLVDRLKS